MAFLDMPQVDRASVNSNKSEIELQKHLSQQSGFICRIDVPDKGCDFDVELITDSLNVSSWRFALQLKSVETLSPVLNGEYISYSFETSRLGYLIRRLPAMGIIALYSIERDVIYFDYVDLVYKRLMSERDSDDWKHNEKVNIHIPVENILNSENVKSIHDVFCNRFSQAEKMQFSHGEKYGLPSIRLADEETYDWNNIEDIKRMLHNYGLFLFNDYDFHIVYHFISKLPHLEISGDKDLLLIAAATYCEVGMYAEADLYVNKLIRHDNFSETENLIAQFVQLKVDLGLGRIKGKEFAKRSAELAAEDTNEHNSIVLQINLVFYELLDLIFTDDIPETLEIRINSIFSRIDSCGSVSEGVKIILMIRNTENLSILLNRYTRNDISNIQFQISIGSIPPKSERKRSIEKFWEREQTFLSLIQDINNRILANGYELQTAYLQAMVVRNFLSKQVDFVSYGVAEPSDSNKELLHSRVQLSLNAFQIFLSFNHFREAYTSLGEALEMIELSRSYYKYVDDFDQAQLEKLRKQLQQQYSFPVHGEVVRKLIAISNENREKESSKNDYSFLADFSYDQIIWFAKKIVKAYNLDTEVINNVVELLKAYQLFYQRCTRADLIVLQTFNDDYRYPVRFVLKSNSSDIVSSESSDMDHLLKQFGL